MKLFHGADPGRCEPGLVLQPREGATVQQSVYEALRRALMSGWFRPGSTISLRSTAAALGTSLTPVREALRRLESEGGLSKGTNRMLTVPTLSAEGLMEVRRIRVALEGLATETAAALITPDELDAVTAACGAMDRAAEVDDIDGYLQNNWRFHSTIYRAARSTLLLQMIEGLWLRVGPLIRLATPSPGHLAHSMEAHWQANEALRAGDGARARAAIERDISDAAHDLSLILQSQQQEASNP
jgi:DNA-binding GntR family transcriptional regulator